MRRLYSALLAMPRKDATTFIAVAQGYARIQEKTRVLNFSESRMQTCEDMVGI